MPFPRVHTQLRAQHTALIVDVDEAQITIAVTGIVPTEGIFTEFSGAVVVIVSIAAGCHGSELGARQCQIGQF
jgi:hypothetical protein